MIQRSFNINANYLVMAAEMLNRHTRSIRPSTSAISGTRSITPRRRTIVLQSAGLPPGGAEGVANIAQLKAKPTSSGARDSIVHCDAVLAAATEAWLMEVAPRVGGSSSGLVEGIRAHAFMYNNVHDAEDYGTITTYLRMQGLVPPSSALHPAAPARGATPPAR